MNEKCEHNLTEVIVQQSKYDVENNSSKKYSQSADPPDKLCQNTDIFIETRACR